MCSPYRLTGADSAVYMGPLCNCARPLLAALLSIENGRTMEKLDHPQPAEFPDDLPKSAKEREHIAKIGHSRVDPVLWQARIEQSSTTISAVAHRSRAACQRLFRTVEAAIAPGTDRRTSSSRVGSVAETPQPN